MSKLTNAGLERIVGQAVVKLIVQDKAAIALLTNAVASELDKPRRSLSEPPKAP